jgi:hypothetical protein
MTDRDFPARWLLRGADQGQLIRLTKALHDLAPLARCGDDLIALGEAGVQFSKSLTDVRLTSM